MYLSPDCQLKLIVRFPLAPLARLWSVPKSPLYVGVFATSSTVTDETVNAFAPVFVTEITVWLAGNVTLVIFSSSVFMKVSVSAPIQAATAMETATVTAISMIAATTGLKAFLLFRSFFIFWFIPPFEFTREIIQYLDLNLTT